MKKQGFLLIALFVPLIVVFLLLPACTFKRTWVNNGVRHMDTSFIEVGETTWQEVVRELGPANPSAALENPLKNVSSRHLKYVFTENKTTQFILPILVLIIFEWHDQHPVRELLIEFDEAGKVTGVYLTTGDTLWRPVEGEDSRAPQVTEDLTGGWGP
jgi:hypothetical protein